MFTSSPSGLNTEVKTVRGEGKSTQTGAIAGTYVVTLAPPEGFGLTSITCSDSDSTGKLDLKQAVILLAQAEDVVCTFSAVNSRKKTVEVISQFMGRRADFLLSNGPGTNRQMDRLQAANSDSEGQGSQENLTSAAGYSAPMNGLSRLGGETPLIGGARAGSRNSSLGAPSIDDGNDFDQPAASGSGALDAGERPGLSPIIVSGSNDGPARLSFATSLSQAMKYLADGQSRKSSLDSASDAPGLGGAPNAMAKRPFVPFDIWLEGHYQRFTDGRDHTGSEGGFGVAYLGADYVLSPWLLIGALVQYDSMEQSSSKDAFKIEGHGWMAGPYATLRLSDHVFLQGRAAWGRSENEVSPFLTYTDSFDSTRWLASSTLTGQWEQGPWQLRPTASLAFIEDRSQIYTDSLGVTIPGLAASLGQFKAGPEIAYRYEAADGTVIAPHIGLEAIWNFSSSDEVVDFGGTLSGPEELRGRIELGADAKLPSGIGLNFSGSYDGVGSDDFQSVGGKAMMRIPLN